MKRCVYLLAALLLSGGMLFTGCSTDVGGTDNLNPEENTRAMSSGQIGQIVNNPLWLEVSYNSSTNKHTVTIHADMEMKPYRYVLYINPTGSYNYGDFMPVYFWNQERPVFTYTFTYTGSSLPFTADYRVIGQSLYGYSDYPGLPREDREICLTTYSSEVLRYPASSGPGNPGGILICSNCDGAGCYLCKRSDFDPNL